MKATRGYKTELDPTSAQSILFCKCAGAARFAYNYGLARKQAAYQAGQKTPTAIDLQKELTARKHNDFPWLAEVSKWAVQNALRDLDNAYRHFFRKVALKKQGKWKGKCGYPRFKSKRKGRGSFRLDAPVQVFDDAVQLPKIGRVRLKESGYIPTWGVKILSATISEHAGKWFVSVLVEEERAEPLAAKGPAIGIDLGVMRLATCSDGQTFDNPKALRSRLKALKRASRQHSKKQKGSRNRKKAQRKLARLHMRIANIRKDALHKATSALVAKTKPDTERPAVMVLEDLHIAGMLKNRKLSGAIADVGMYEFKRQLSYKAAWAGVEIKEVSRWYPSSKTCSACGQVKEELSLQTRLYICEQCGFTMDRDVNAALNLAALA
jgi:putative transposase